MTIRQFNIAVEQADKLTGYLLDTRSVQELIWMLVSMGHLGAATFLRDAYEDLQAMDFVDKLNAVAGGMKPWKHQNNGS